MTPLTGMIDPQVLIDGGRNTIVYEADAAIRQELFKAFSTNHSPHSAAGRCTPAVLPSGGGAALGAAPPSYDQVFRVIIMQFLDRHSLDLRSVRKTCVHIAHPDGKRVIPFDTYNLFYRDDLEQRVLAPLRAETVAPT